MSSGTSGVDRRTFFDKSRTLFGATVLAIGLFLLVPLTQMLSDLKRDQVVFRKMAVTAAPPPRTPPSPEKETHPLQEQVPELERSLQELSLRQLELSLNPGLGDALVMGAGSFQLDTEVDVMREVEQLFDFSEIDGAPRILSSPRFDFPSALERRGVKECRIELLIEIDEEGRATVRDVLKASHPEIVPMARGLVERSRFTIPTYDGKPVKVQGAFPLTLGSPRK